MLEEEIKKLVNEKLPQLAAESIGKMIEELEAAREKIDFLEKGNCVRSKKYNDMDAEFCAFKTKAGRLDARADALNKREADVTHFEHRKALLLKDINCGNDKVLLLQGMMNTIFRNTEIRSTVFMEKDIIIPQGDYPATTQRSNETETKTETQD